MKKPKIYKIKNRVESEQVIETLRMMKFPQKKKPEIIKLSQEEFRKISRKNMYWIRQIENKLELL